MLIYKYYNGEMYEWEVVETKKTYKGVKCAGLAWSCATSIPKPLGRLTPKDAIDYRKEILLTTIGMLTEKVNKATIEMEELKKL